MSYDIAAGILMALGALMAIAAPVFFIQRMIYAQTEPAKRFAWSLSVITACVAAGVLAGIFAP